MSPAALRIILFGFLLSIPAFGQHPLEPSFAVRVSPRRLTQSVRDLVAFGNRQGGTPSGDKSAAFVEARFRSFGISAWSVADDERRVWQNERWTLAVDQPKRLRGLIQHAALAGFSPSVPTQTARLALASDDENMVWGSLDSAVVLFIGKEGKWRARYHKIVEAGALALLVFEREGIVGYGQAAEVHILSAKSENPIPVYSIPAAAGNRLQTELERGNGIRIRFGARTKTGTGTPKTVVAEIPGTSTRYIVVCAHGDSDSGGPGADDNASGVSGVIELARVFSGMLRGSKQYVPTVGIRFIVWGTEYHSAYSYIKRNADSLDRIAAVINFDEIGYGSSRDCLYFEGNDIEVNEKLLRLFNGIGEAHRGKPGFWSEATTNPSQGGTDSYAFLRRSLERLDVPAVDIPSITIYTTAWNTPRTLPQTEGWTSSAWGGHPDSVTIDYSPYYHSTLDIPRLTTDKEPFNMMWGVKAVGLALLRTIFVPQPIVN